MSESPLDDLSNYRSLLGNPDCYITQLSPPSPAIKSNDLAIVFWIQLTLIYDSQKYIEQILNSSTLVRDTKWQFMG
ncbi:hypothetical protein FKM82_028099 [Ascaphus truei]